MAKKIREIRVQDAPVLREAEEGKESRTIFGYAIVFNRESVLLCDWSECYKEVILPEAIDMDLLNRSDIQMTLWHNREKLIARRKNGVGTLEVGIDDHGVWYQFEAPHTPDGDTALELVKRGDLAGCSFAYSCNEKADVEYELNADGDTVRKVKKIRGIYDMTIASDPAYEDTSVEAREAHTALREAAEQSETPTEAPAETPAETPSETPSEEAGNNSQEGEEGTPAEAESNTSPEAETQPNEAENANNEETPSGHEESELQERELPFNSDNTMNVREQFDAFMRGIQGVKNAVLQRAVTTETTNVDGMIPVTIGDIVKPLRERLIYPLVGIDIKTNLSGAYVFPGMNAVEASFGEEAVTINDSDATFVKVVPSPKRVGISFLVANQVISQTDEMAYDMLVEECANGTADVINKAIFSPVQVSKAFAGPFVYCAAQAATTLASAKTAAARKGIYNLQFAGDLPTYKELLAMKAIVLSRGAQGLQYAAYVMSEATKAELEATPKDAGSGMMICVDDRINGIPVFCTNAIGEKVGFGLWNNALLGHFGDFRLVIDRISEAQKDATRISLNSDWGADVKHKEAFILGAAAE